MCARLLLLWRGLFPRAGFVGGRALLREVRPQKTTSFCTGKHCTIITIIIIKTMNYEQYIHSLVEIFEADYEKLNNKQRSRILCLVMMELSL